MWDQILGLEKAWLLVLEALLLRFNPVIPVPTAPSSSRCHALLPLSRQVLHVSVLCHQFIRLLHSHFSPTYFSIP